MIPSQLLCAVWRHASHLAVPDQHDAHEFFMALLDGYSSHAEKYHNIPIPDTPSKPGSYHFKGIFNEVCTRDYSVLCAVNTADVLRCAALRSTLQCLRSLVLSQYISRLIYCRSAKYDPFVDISVSLDDVETQLKVEDMLSKFTTVETLHDRAVREIQRCSIDT